MKFKQGNIVKFKKDDTLAPSHKMFIRPKDIRHGNYKFHSDYKKEFATVTRVDEKNNYYMVRFKDKHEKYVVLPYAEKHLELVKTITWKEKMERSD